MKTQLIYKDQDCEWIVLGRDPSKPDEVIDTLQYIIDTPDETMVLDPGGTEIFPSVLSGVSELVNLDKIGKFLCSHQDPDIMSSLPLWMSLCSQAKIYLPWVWKGFVAHFGKEFYSSFQLVPDNDIEIVLGKNKKLMILNAHFMHSSGNLNLFDPVSKILFSGDTGAALVPDESDIFVQDIDQHIKYMQGFHQRWMPSNEHKNRWVKKIRKLEPKMICPQHGSIFMDDQVFKFLDWLEQLDVGKY